MKITIEGRPAEGKSTLLQGTHSRNNKEVNYENKRMQS